MRRRVILSRLITAIFIMIAPLFLSASVSFSLSSERIANAQTILFELQEDDVLKPIDRAYVAHLGTRYPFYTHPQKGQGYFYAFVPTSYHTKSQKKDAVIVYIKGGRKHYISVPIMIEKGKYGSERLHVHSSRASISKENKARIQRESREAKKIYRTFTKNSYISGPFLRPLDTKITSVFGTKRVFNGVLKSYHSGTDFRAPVGTPLIASNAGKVVIAKERFFAGYSIVIDHGHGIYTGYYHMSKVHVKKGDMVGRGEKIGLAGATGRVTGPHLHFAVHVGGVNVDPMQFLEIVNRLY